MKPCVKHADAGDVACVESACRVFERLVHVMARQQRGKSTLLNVLAGRQLNNRRRGILYADVYLCVRVHALAITVCQTYSASTSQTCWDLRTP